MDTQVNIMVVKKEHSSCTGEDTLHIFVKNPMSILRIQ